LWHLDSHNGHHLFSVDEKTGIQAKEMKERNPQKSGQLRRMEFEYKRHGTTCLTGAVNVSTGKMECYQIQSTRKEEDFVKFIDKLCQGIPKTDKVTILLDQLNTHKSESLVKWVAQQIEYAGDLGKKKFKGILKNQQSRMIFLETQDHRIRFVYTPKHCSWLNPIENWFGKLQRQRLRHASFSSVKELESALIDYIHFSNEWFAKPYKWKFKGFLKNKKLILE
jgi:transposase